MTYLRRAGEPDLFLQLIVDPAREPVRSALP